MSWKKSKSSTQIDLEYDPIFDASIMAVSKSTEKNSKDKSAKDRIMTSQKSREKHVKDNMASIGAGRVQAKIMSHTEEPENKEDK